MKAQTSAAGKGTVKPPSIWLPRPSFLPAGVAAAGTDAGLAAAAPALSATGVNPAKAACRAVSGAAPRPCARAARSASTAGSGCARSSASTDITAATMPM